MATQGRSTIRYNDYGGEGSTVSLRSEELTAVNFDAEGSKFLAFRDALAAITLGLRISYTHGNREETLAPGSEAASPLAQREAKWLVRYHSATGTDQYRMEIPCADLTLLDSNNKGFAEMGDAGVVDAFVSAFESFVLAEGGGAVVVDSIQHVGRNV